MKKRNIFLTVLIMSLSISSLLFAQNAPIDFEDGGYGADWTWAVFENDTNPALEIVDNPDATGINTSSTVAKFTALQTGQPWAGCESQHGADIGEFSFSTENSTVKIMVWKSVISDVGLKFVEANGEAQPEVKVANTLTNQWEELTFDLSGSIGAGITGIIDQIVIFPDFDLEGRTQDNICYFDNISFHPQGDVVVPSTPAPTPQIAANNVISLFSNAYTNVPVDTWSAEWDVADLNDIQIEGDDVKHYFNLEFAGIEFTSNTIDASNMTNFSMDIWTPDQTTAPAAFNVKLVDFGADGAWSGGDDVEHEITFDATTEPGLASETWVNLDVALADFTNLVTTGHLAQLVISGDLSTVFIDNIFFYNNNSGVNDYTLIPDFSLDGNYPNPFNPTTSIQFSLNTPSGVSLIVYNIRGEKIRTLVDSYLDADQHNVVWDGKNTENKAVSSGVYFYKLQVGNSQKTQKMMLIK